jgi:prevent-host-death family protein
LTRHPEEQNDEGSLASLGMTGENDSSSSELAQQRRREALKKFALSKVKDDLSHFLRLAEAEDILITRHGKPAAVLIGFKSEDDWFDYRLENKPRFLNRVARARRSIRGGARFRLNQLLPKIRKRHLHAEVWSGPIAGREVW